jgi:hypothetical protein
MTARPTTFRPRIEPLEDRRLPSASVDGILLIGPSTHVNALAVHFSDKVDAVIAVSHESFSVEVLRNGQFIRIPFNRPVLNDPQTVTLPFPRSFSLETVKAVQVSVSPGLVGGPGDVQTLRVVSKADKVRFVDARGNLVTLQLADKTIGHIDHGRIDVVFLGDSNADEVWVPGNGHTLAGRVVAGPGSDGITSIESLRIGPNRERLPGSFVLEQLVLDPNAPPSFIDPISDL